MGPQGAEEKARQDLANDINPADERRNANLPDRLFEAVARHWLGKLAKKVRLGKRSVKTLEKATWALETYVFPLESLPVSAIRRLRGQMPSEGEAAESHRQYSLAVGHY